jgi:hypothetical protein
MAKMDKLKIPCTFACDEPKAGWRATATFRGRPAVIEQSHSLGTARSRLTRALEALGARNFQLVEEVRIPADLQAELDAHLELRHRIMELKERYAQQTPRLGNRLCTLLNLSEREAAIFLGISNTRLGEILRAHASGTDVTTTITSTSTRSRSAR